jgi:hypothetical protein
MGVAKKPGVACTPSIQHGRAKRQVRKTSIFAALSFNAQISFKWSINVIPVWTPGREKPSTQRSSPRENGHLITRFSVSTHA